MLKNYLKISWRKLKNDKVYTSINIIGLSVALASCLIIFLFIQFETSYDEYHKKSERIYRVYRHYEARGRNLNELMTSKLLTPTLLQKIPGIANTMRLSTRYSEIMVKQGKNIFFEQKFYFTDPSIFNIFSFQLLKGNPQTALNRPFAVVLTKEMADKYFGDESAMGQTITIRGSWGPDEYVVTGIIKKLSANSHFTINFLTSYETLRAVSPLEPDEFANWRYTDSYTYILLKQGITPNELTNELKSFVSRHRGEKAASIMSYRFQPITKIHLYSHFQREIEPGGDPRYLYIFGCIALLILLIAGINYANLATSRSAGRSVEVGIRKILGIRRKGLIMQFLCESVIFCFLSLVLALVLVQLLLPWFNDLAGIPLSLNLTDPSFLLVLIGATILIALLAGIYPALVMSGFKPARLFNHSTGKSKSFLRNSLVVVQYAVSVVLIIGTFVIANQLGFIRNKPLGFTKERVLLLKSGVGTQFNKNYQPFKNRLLSYTNIKSITHSSAEFPLSGDFGFSLAPQGLEMREVNTFSVGKDFIQTLGIKLLKGRDISDLSSVMKSDSTGAQFMPVLINKTAAKEWGWEKPLGKTFDGFSPIFRVAGVVENFHYTSLKKEVQPLVIWPSNYSVNNLYIRLSTDDLQKTLSAIKKTWNELGPATPLTYSFLNEQFEATLKAEDRFASVFKSFTLLAVIISCLGLFGLVAYTVERRRKEIGIRKVLGATVTNIVGLLSKDFLKLVLIGFVIAVPLAWYFMQQWLQDFAYRIDIGIGIFLLAGGLALLIALATVSWQSIRAALANPVDSLRSE